MVDKFYFTQEIINDLETVTFVRDCYVHTLCYELIYYVKIVRYFNIFFNFKLYQ